MWVFCVFFLVWVAGADICWAFPCICGQSVDFLVAGGSRDASYTCWWLQALSIGQGVVGLHESHSPTD